VVIHQQWLKAITALNLTNWIIAGKCTEEHKMAGFMQFGDNDCCKESCYRRKLQGNGLLASFPE
jgi:hypothetical protein